MKKWFFRLGALVLVLLVALVVGGTWFLGGVLRKGVETVGPRITGTKVRLVDASLSPLSGQGDLDGFAIANPEGYDAPDAIRVGRVSLKVEPRSLFQDKIIVRSLIIDAPEITLEGGFKENNLNQILEHVRAVAERVERPSRPGQTEEAEEAGVATKLQVDEFLIRGTKVRYAIKGLGGTALSYELPALELRDLGQGEEGITVAELLDKALSQLTRTSLEEAKDAGSGSVTDAARKILGL